LSSLPIELATESHQFSGFLTAELKDRRPIDLLNDERTMRLRLCEARMRDHQEEEWRPRSVIEVMRHSMLWVGLPTPPGSGRPEYRIEKVTRRVGFLVPPFEIDATLFVAEDAPTEEPLGGIFLPFFIASQACVRLGSTARTWPLIAVNRSRIVAAWSL
jgi:hypothetical protein